MKPLNSNMKVHTIYKIYFGNFCLFDSRMFTSSYSNTVPLFMLKWYLKQSIVDEVEPITFLEQLMLLLGRFGFSKD